MIDYLHFGLICLFFGSNFILMDRATRWFGPIEVGAGRLVGAPLVLGVIWLAWERRGRLRWADARDLAIVGLVGNAYPYVVQPSLIRSGFGHSFFGTMVAFTPLLTVIVSMPLLGVRPTARQLLGVLGGLACVALLMHDGHARSIGPWVLAAAVTVPLSYALGNTWLKRTLADAPPTPVALAIMAISAAAVAPLAMSSAAQATVGVAPPDPRTGFAAAAASLAVLGAVGTGACVWMFVRLVQRRGPLFAGMVTYVVPVVALMWGLFDSERITGTQLCAVAGVLAMVTLVQAPQRKRASAADASDYTPDATPAEA